MKKLLIMLTILSAFTVQTFAGTVMQQDTTKKSKKEKPWKKSKKDTTARDTTVKPPVKA